MKKIFRLGTRGSPLALVQAQIVRDSLYARFPELQKEAVVEIVPIRTTGDWQPQQAERSFLELGGTKGLFTKEIEEALYTGTIDFAVHSMKDVSVWVPKGLEFVAMLPREDPRDVLLSGLAPTLQDLPAGATIGTSSLRRRAQILAQRPDLCVVPLRGNIDTRMKKLAAGDADATILAMAGIKRLGAMDRIASILDTQTMLPAAAQGVLGIEIRDDSLMLYEYLSKLNDPVTQACVTAERAFLEVLDGSCRTPIAVLGGVDADGDMTLDGLVVRANGTDMHRSQRTAPMADARALGRQLGEEIKAQMPEDLLTCSV